MTRSASPRQVTTYEAYMEAQKIRARLSDYMRGCLALTEDKRELIAAEVVRLDRWMQANKKLVVFEVESEWNL